MPPPPPKKSAKPLIAGIMYILSMLVGLAFIQVAIASLTLGAAAASSSLPGGGMLGGLGIALGALIIIGIVGSLLAAICCFMRKMYMIGILGGILAFVGLHFIFGLVGFILMATSKQQFS